jgi:hypothetical protein|tara:strand:- start:128 stop:328 length:201 start_codon:yes stop_codon:yes gene_type:complete
MILFGRSLSIEYRLGVGIDLEFADGRAVWIYDPSTGEMGAMPFMGTLISLPLCLISYGRVYEEVDE